MKKKSKSNSLKNRMKRSYENREGRSRSSALDFSKLDDIKFFEPKLDKNYIDIVPYIITTKNDHLIHSGDAELNDPSYMLELYLHTFIGPTHAEIICPKSNFFKECPICKQAQELKDAGKKDDAGELWPSLFCYYNVIDKTKPEEGLKVFKIKFNKFEKQLVTAARVAATIANDDEDDKPSNSAENYIDFSSIDDGQSIKFWGENVTKAIKGRQSTYLEFSNFTFTKRKTALDESLMDEAVKFDTLMKIQTPKQIETLLYGEDKESDDEDEKPKKGTSKKKPDIDDDDEDEPPKKTSKKPPAKKKPIEEDDDEEDDEDDEEEDTDEDADESDDDTDEEDEAEEDNEDETDDDEDDEPPPVKKGKTVIGKKPVPLKKKK